MAQHPFQAAISEAELIRRHNETLAAQQQAERQQQEQTPPASRSRDDGGMSEQRFTLDNSGSAFTPREPRTPVFRHNLRFENHSKVLDWEPGSMYSVRVPTGETTVTCACGLDTGAVPSGDARLAYEAHRNLVRNEIAAKTDG
ncbi:hypothetical protein AB0469_31845 [Streptomyces sp. NPDC093801]|uniref:hypothetical protein n=1 Tax=Streptomyces sp. NPDC093801 TaxID=3155203 RepID=UPI00344C04C5